MIGTGTIHLEGQMTKITIDQIDDLVELVQEKIHNIISGEISGIPGGDAEAVLDLEHLDTTLAAMRAAIGTDVSPQYQYGYRLQRGHGEPRDYWRSTADRARYPTQSDETWARSKVKHLDRALLYSSALLIRREIRTVAVVEG
jgi:hypothetical protein